MQGVADEALAAARAAASQVDATELELSNVARSVLNAATKPDLDALRAALQELHAEVPSSSDLGKVKGQLESLEQGMAALDDLAQMRADVDMLLGKLPKLNELAADVELSKEDLLATQTALERTQGQAADAQEHAVRLAARLDDLEGMATELDAVSAQVLVLGLVDRCALVSGACTMLCLSARIHRQSCCR